MEEHIRSVAMDQCRSSQKIPWGKALMNALRSEAHKWQEFRDFLTPTETRHGKPNGGNKDGGKGNGAHNQNSSKPLPPPPHPKGKGKGKGDAAKLKFAPSMRMERCFATTATVLSEGATRVNRANSCTHVTQ